MAGECLLTAVDNRGRPLPPRTHDVARPVDAFAHEMGWSVRMALVTGENLGSTWDRYSLLVHRFENAGHRFAFWDAER